MKKAAGFLIVFILGIVVGAAINQSAQKEHSLRTETPEMISNTPEQVRHSTPSRLPSVTKWAHGIVNVRAGRGTIHEVVQTLDRGESVQADSLIDGWYRVLSAGRALGYVSQTVLQDDPLPRYDLKLHDVSFRVTERNNTWWRFAWTLDLENKGLMPIAGIEAELQFLDDDGFVIDSDREYSITLRSGERKTVRGYQLVDVPGAASVASVSASVGVR